eukprot:6213187-Pleurochrysis_carterae.AAC.1
MSYIFIACDLAIEIVKLATQAARAESAPQWKVTLRASKRRRLYFRHLQHGLYLATHHRHHHRLLVTTTACPARDYTGHAKISCSLFLLPMGPGRLARSSV